MGGIISRRSKTKSNSNANGSSNSNNANNASSNTSQPESSVVATTATPSSIESLQKDEETSSSSSATPETKPLSLSSDQKSSDTSPTNNSTNINNNPTTESSNNTATNSTPANTATESPRITANTNQSAVNYEGQTISWLIRFALDHNIDGYGRWCLERYWIERVITSVAEKGYSKNLATKAVLALKKETNDGYYHEDELADWAAQHAQDEGINDDLKELQTTATVCQSIIVPATAKDKITFSDIINPPHKGKATHFVSHSWGYPFWSLVEGLIMHQLDCKREILYTLSLHEIFKKLANIEQPNYYWLDIINKNQHVVNSGDTIVELANCIREISQVVLVLHPVTTWALSRVWCLFEVLTTLQEKAKLGIALSFRFVDVIENEKIIDENKQKENEAVPIPWSDLKRYDMFQQVDVRNANSTLPADKTMIFQKIELGVGFETMNGNVEQAIVAAFSVVHSGLQV